MKGKFIVFFVCVLFLSLGACAFTPTPYDPSIPLEESATILFMGVKISEYNGIAIPPKKKYSDYNDSPWVFMALPPGTMNFVADVAWYIDSGNIRHLYRAREQKFSYKFEAGLEYIVQFAIRDSVWGVEIYQMKVPRAYVDLPKDKLVAFIPFEK